MVHRFRDEWLVPIARDVHGVPDDLIESARQASSPFLATALIRSGAVADAALAESVSKRYGCSCVKPMPDALDRAVLAAVPERVCRKHLVLPFALDGAKVRVATANPLDVAIEDEIRFAAGRRPELSYCTPDHLEDLIAHLLDPHQVIFDLLRKVEVSQPVELLVTTDSDDEEDMVHAPIIRLVNAIVAKGVALKASDIHIEHDERASQVRYRVDGTLRTSLTLPRYVAAGPVVSRLKIMAKLDVAERRRPQDGQAKLRVGDATVSLRVSTLPTQFGEKVVARVLDARNARVSLSALGLRPDIASRLRRQLSAEQGFILVTGPTGSGKTTTLYAAVSSLADGATNVVSIEDPIEYQLSGVNQVQVNEKQGLTFASVMRSVLRQDPDVILVGEIRDAETADVACQAAMTGHLVLSTLHTNDATTAVARLTDMGVDEYKVISSLRAVVAQRLVRKLCSCRRTVDVDSLPPAARHVIRREGFPQTAHAPVGCASCQFTGFAGRVPVTEMLELTPAFVDALPSLSSAAEMRAKALELGALEPMERDALWHVTNGAVSFDDVSGYLEQPDGNAVDLQEVPDGRGAPIPSRKTPFRVLVADGDQVRCRRSASLLEAVGFEVDSALDGPTAIAAMARRPPDAIVVSANLPILSGIDLVRYTRAGAGLISIPVLVVVETFDGNTAAFSSAGATDVVASADLDEQIVRLLRAALTRSTDFSAAADIMTARLPQDEDQRLRALRATRLLDSPREERFDTITRLAARTFGAPIAVVTLVDEARQWFKAAEGIDGTETPREHAFCAHAILNEDVMVVTDAALDPRFAENPLVAGDPHIRFYAGCPVSTPDGQPLGTLCVVDRVPRRFTERDKHTLRELAALVEREIAASLHEAPGDQPQAPSLPARA